jgi:hypothetical protein
MNHMKPTVKPLTQRPAWKAITAHYLFVYFVYFVVSLALALFSTP